MESIVFWRLARGMSSTGSVSLSSTGCPSSTERLVPERGACRHLGMRIGGSNGSSNGGSKSGPDRHSGNRADGMCYSLNLQAGHVPQRP